MSFSSPRYNKEVEIDWEQVAEKITAEYEEEAARAGGSADDAGVANRTRRK